MLRDKIGHGLHALRALVFVLWWMVVAFAGIFAAYIMLKS